jgi:hypothetical protein
VFYNSMILIRSVMKMTRTYWWWLYLQISDL